MLLRNVSNCLLDREPRFMQTVTRFLKLILAINQLNTQILVL